MAEASTTLLTFENLIGGRRVPAADGRTSDVIDPTTGEAYATAPVSGPADVDAAMRAAASAFEVWRETTPGERQRALLRRLRGRQRRWQLLLQLLRGAPPCCAG